MQRLRASSTYLETSIHDPCFRRNCALRHGRKIDGKVHALLFSWRARNRHLLSVRIWLLEQSMPSAAVLSCHLSHRIQFLVLVANFFVAIKFVRHQLPTFLPLYNTSFHLLPLEKAEKTDLKILKWTILKKRWWQPSSWYPNPTMYLTMTFLKFNRFRPARPGLQMKKYSKPNYYRRKKLRLESIYLSTRKKWGTYLHKYSTKKKLCSTSRR